MSDTPESGALGGRTLRRIVVLGGVAYASQGFDITVYGTTVPSLIDEWKISPPHAGAIGSSMLAGMLVGALLITTVVNRVERKVLMIGCVTFFSVMMAMCALAPSPEVFTVVRFLAGTGLGASLPPVMAYTMEYAPEGRRNVTFAIMASGASVGGSLSAAIAIPIIPSLGWRPMYLICALPVLVYMPVAVRALPPSLESLVVRGKVPEAQALAWRLGMSVPAAAAVRSGRPRGIVALFSRQYVVVTLLFWLAMFCALFLLATMPTWLPELMRRSGYPLDSALSFLFVFYLGAIVGTLLAARAADRFNSKAVILVAFLSSATAIGLVSVTGNTVALYAFFLLGGFGTVGTQVLFEAFVLQYYPLEVREPGLGWAFAVGRIGGIVGPLLGGLLLAAQLSVGAIFLVFACVALLGAAAITLVRRAPLQVGPPATTLAGDMEGAT